MSTIPKEIQDKIEAVALGLYPIYEGELEKYNWESEPCRKDYIAAAIYGYQLATDGREELEKELWAENENIVYRNKRIEELAKKCDVLREQTRSDNQKITAIQSSLKEKEKECERLKEKADSWGLCMQAVRQKNSEIEELKAENERLKALLSRLEDYFDDRADVQDGDNEDYIPRPNTEMSFLSEIRDLT